VLLKGVVGLACIAWTGQIGDLNPLGMGILGITLAHACDRALACGD
jgi:hypothetical protein